MRKIILLSFLITAAACSSGPKIESTKFSLRPYREETLSNGLRLLMVEDNSLPLITLNLMVQVGSLEDKKGLEGINALTAGLLDQGAGQRSAEALAAQFNQLGTEVTQSPGSDATFIRVTGLSSTSNKLLDLFSDVAMRPAFYPKEIERVRSETLAALQRTPDHPPSFADLLISSKVYRDHPYGFSSLGTIESVKKIQKSDIASHYFHYYRPNNSILAITGRFDDEFLKRVRTVFGSWQQNRIEEPKYSVPMMAERPDIVLVSKSDLAQTQVRWAHIALKRNDPDFIPLRLATLVLGGAFASRLNQKIRDDLGLTYSISSTLDARLNSGAFQISTFTRNQKVGEVLTETRKVLEDFVKRGVTGEELAAAKNYLISQFPSTVETANQFALQLMYLRLYGVSDSYLFDYQANIDKFTVADVNKVIRKYIHPSQMQVVVFGDETQVLDQLKKVGTVKIEPARVR